MATTIWRDGSPLRGQGRIGVRVERVLGRYMVGWLSLRTIEDDSLTRTRDEVRIAEEAVLDVLCVYLCQHRQRRPAGPPARNVSVERRRPRTG